MTSHSSLLVLLLLILIAVWWDVRYRRIPNWLTFSGIIIGFLFQLVTGGVTGLKFAVLGFGLGAAILLIPYYKGGIGAGDVKLLAMIGTWTGVEFLLPACLWMGIFGAVLSLYYIWREKVWKLTLIGLTNNDYKTGIKVPYGVAIGLGTFMESARIVWFPTGGWTL